MVGKSSGIDALARTASLRLRPSSRSGVAVVRPAAQEVVTDDAQALNAVMQPIEARCLELPEAMGNHAAPSFETILKAIAKAQAEAVRQKMSTAKCCRVVDQLIEIQPDGSIVRGNHCAGADADDRVNPNAVLNQPPNDANMSGAAQPARAQNQTDANRFCHGHNLCSLG